MFLVSLAVSVFTKGTSGGLTLDCLPDSIQPLFPASTELGIIESLELKGTLGGHIVHLLCNEQGLTARSGSSEPGQPDLENVVRK